MNIIVLLLNILGLVFLLRYMLQQRKEYLAMEDKRAFFTFKRFRYSILLLLTIGIPLFLGNIVVPLVFPEPLFAVNANPITIWWCSLGLALLISGVWIMYVQRLDIYEPEQWGYLLLTFILSGLSTHYLCPWMYMTLADFGYDLYSDGSMLYSFLYCVLAIGGIEETCKILPVLAILWIFRKAINEPYDYILYASVSALGFAFVENIDYIFFSRMYNISGRALYAAVAHMTFTSTFFYGLMLWRFGFTRLKLYWVTPLFFILSIGSHGFYDFWLLNDWVSEYKEMTTVFFLITVHLWVTMKNNTINASNFYTNDISINNDRLRYYLIISLTGLVMLGYLIVAIGDGPALANSYLFYEVLAYGYLIFYLAFGLSRYRIAQGEMNPFQVPFDFFVPRPAPPAQEEED